VAVDWKRLLPIMKVQSSLITLIWWIWLRYELPKWSAYIFYLLVALCCLYFAAFKAQRMEKSKSASCMHWDLNIGSLQINIISCKDSVRNPETRK